MKFLLDENLEHEVRHRLSKLGYEVTHVELEPTLGKGTTDTSIAEVSLERGWIIVTYDPDFVTDHSESEYFGAVYFEDDDLSAKEVADVLHTMASAYPESEFGQLQFGGREWL